MSDIAWVNSGYIKRIWAVTEIVCSCLPHTWLIQLPRNEHLRMQPLANIPILGAPRALPWTAIPNINHNTCLLKLIEWHILPIIRYYGWRSPIHPQNTWKWITNHRGMNMKERKHWHIFLDIKVMLLMEPVEITSRTILINS